MARKVDRGAKRLQILTAAVGCFAKSGFAATAMDDIAAAAGVSKGSLYDYFKNKEDMFYAVFEWIQTSQLKAVTPAAAAKRPPRQRLVAFIDETVDGSMQMIELYPLTMEVWAATATNPQARQRFMKAMRALYDSYRGHIAALIAETKAAREMSAKVDPQALASALFAVIDGLMMQYCIKPDFDPRTVVRSFVDALFDGVAPR